MRVVETVAEMRELARAWQADGRAVALVPTMGALHRGHLSLVEAARQPDARVVASIFVNPLQFGPGEDFDSYPRAFDDDMRMLSEAGVDAVFQPSVAEMYPAGSDTRVVPGAVAARLEGERRPGHFTGVATVVTRLFAVTHADRAYFGRKDAQQLAVVRAAVRDLGLPVDVVGCPTIREADGLAMSSRNRYLGPADRAAATVLARALGRAQELFATGVDEPARLIDAILSELSALPGVAADYAALADPDTFAEPGRANSATLALVAARVGLARLIDNAALGAGDLIAFAHPHDEEVFAWNA